MDQLISKICFSQALLWRGESLIFFSNLEMINSLQFIPRHAHIETILEISSARFHNLDNMERKK